MSIVEKLFSFQGRLRRRDYWIISLILTALVLGAEEAFGFEILGKWPSLLDGSFVKATQNSRFKIFQLICASIVIWPNLALTAKRRHDRNKSAVFAMAVILIIDIFSETIQITGHMKYEVIFYTGGMLFMTIGSIWLLIVIGCLDGTRGPNRFGPSPKGIGGSVGEGAGADPI